MGKPNYSLRELVIYFLKLGSIGFGGPVALVGYMHRDLVEKKKWISGDDYKEGMALAQLAPGPLAAQLAIYIGYIHYGIIGATLSGIAFVIPSFFIVVGIGIAYVHYGGLSWMQAVFYGVGSAVIGIIAVSSYKLTKKSIGKDYLLWSIFVVLAVATWYWESESILLVITAGILVWLIKSPPDKKISFGTFTPVLLLLKIPFTISSGTKLWQLTWFFSKAGAFVFGSGLAIVPFLYGGVVNDYKWLNEQQFLDAVAVAMITPGPVVITVAFIGFLVAGFPGACIAAAATFLPCYLFTILPAPYFKKYGKHPGIKAFVDGVTTAAIGAIGGSVIVLATRQFSDLTTVGIAMAVAALLLMFKKIQEPYILIAAAALGLLIFNLK